jgi:two-component system alkaline phosphatase synthesis response regulator PhoP/two-component system response regulator VicR
MKKVLIIDDEPHIVMIVKVRLEKAGYKVISAGDGQEGLEKVRSEKPDLILLDQMLPIMGGAEVCNIIKADPEHKRIPVILFTARAQSADICADDIVPKPFKPEVLLEKIAALLKE